MRILRSIGHYFRHTDLYLLFLALCCSGFGAVLVFSATRTMGSNQYIIIQLSATALGLFAFVLMSLFDLEDMSRYWKWFLLLNIGFQLLLFPFGFGEGGNHSWLRFGPIGIQPGEIGKVLFIFTFAAHVEREYDRLNYWRTLLGLALHLVIVMGAVVVPSSDLGVGISYLFVFIIMLFGAGLSLKWFAGGAVAALASVPFIWQLFSGDGNAYRLTRILVLFDPSISPGTAWHTEKSKIAIGAGEIFGAGFLQGNQMQHSHFPGKHTDFIFAVAGEEFGLIGSLAILALLSLLIHFELKSSQTRTEEKP